MRFLSMLSTVESLGKTEMTQEHSIKEGTEHEVT